MDRAASPVCHLGWLTEEVNASAPFSIRRRVSIVEGGSASLSEEVKLVYDWNITEIVLFRRFVKSVSVITCEARIPFPSLLSMIIR